MDDNARPSGCRIAADMFNLNLGFVDDDNDTLTRVLSLQFVN